MKVIIVDWCKYPFKRYKKFGANIVKCGLLRILEGINNYEAGIDFSVWLVITDCQERSEREKYVELMNIYGFIENVFFRDNIGQDIGSYNYAYQVLKKKQYSGDVVFMNTSVDGPHSNNWLSKFKQLFYQKNNIGLCGITLNNENKIIPHFKKKYKPRNPHVQSFFYFTNMNILQDVFLKNLAGHDEYIKKRLIKNGEINISLSVLEKGYGICAISNPEFIYYYGDDWVIPYHSGFRKNKQFSKIINKL